MTEEESPDWDWGGWDYSATFVGCTCEHEPDEHTWGECGIPECPCEGGWEE